MRAYAPIVLLSLSPLGAQTPTAAVTTVLDDWHRAAAQADEARYFGHMAEDAVYMGTDATERWVKKDFQAWSHPYFAKGKAWSFRAVRRAVMFSPDGATAWFDEDLDTPNMGPCRGTGVLSLQQGRWVIRHYNLTVPIPNDLMNEVKGRIEVFLKKAAAK